MQQISNIDYFFRKIFEQFIPETIIELGTGDGEFTVLLDKLISEKSNSYLFFTFDNEIRRKEVSARVQYFCLDIFERKQFIEELFIGKTLLLCDNGDKAREMQIFAHCLKPGDVLMAHDYAYSKEFFEINKFWRTCEITDADIPCLKGFERFNQNLMIQAGWLSLIKTETNENN